MFTDLQFMKLETLQFEKALVHLEQKVLMGPSHGRRKDFFQGGQ